MSTIPFFIRRHFLHFIRIITSHTLYLTYYQTIILNLTLYKDQVGVKKEVQMGNVNLNVFFQEKRQLLSHFASQFTSDYDEKEDLIQETYLRALKSIHDFINDPKLVTWLYVIMKNVYINKYRKEKRKNVIYDYFLHAGFNAYISTNLSENKMINEDIQKAIDSLSTENAEIFRLHLDGYKYHEIAELLQVPEGTIKSRIHMTRKALQQKLKMYDHA